VPSAREICGNPWQRTASVCDADLVSSACERAGVDQEKQHRQFWEGKMLRAIVSIFARVLSLYAFAGATHAASCGPGSDWISVCGSGSQSLRVTMNFGLDTDFNSLADVDVSFTGVMVVERSDPYASDPVNAPGTLDRIDMQIISMDLSGASPFVAGWRFRVGAGEGIDPSFGFIQGQSDSAIALARFDSVFEIDSVQYGVLTHDLNATVFFEDLITALPEIGAKYNHTGGPFGTTIPLFDQDGIEVLRLTDLIATDFITVGRPHFTVDAAVVPIPAVAWLMVSGLGCLAGLGRSWKRGA
jgi:hypothetical protein